MANYKTCKKCGSELLADDIAIHRKLINSSAFKLISRNAEEFLCIDCLAEHFGCTRKDVEELIAYYRESGKCTLFR